MGSWVSAEGFVWLAALSPALHHGERRKAAKDDASMSLARVDKVGPEAAAIVGKRANFRKGTHIPTAKSHAIHESSCSRAVGRP